MSQPEGMFTYANSALVLIDYQPPMFAAIRSEIPAEVVELNVRALIKSAKAMDMPVVLSSVGVRSGTNAATVESIANELPGYQILDRSTMNAWEDTAFKDQVVATGRSRLIFAALWTEICLVYPVISAVADGYDAMVVVDAVGGTSQLAHEVGIQRLTAAGAAPTTTRACIDELFRDWRTPQGAAWRDEILKPWYLPELQELSKANPDARWAVN